MERRWVKKPVNPTDREVGGYFDNLEDYIVPFDTFRYNVKEYCALAVYEKCKER